VNEVVSNMAKMLRRILREDVSMELKQTAQPQIVHADGGMIEQILMNLTVNARDAMPEGGQLLVKVDRVELTDATGAGRPGARPGSFVRLSVSDTGTGIPPEVLPRIFEPFFTTKEIGEGTGLGLATVYSIAQQHLGWIEVDSVMGRGTTFHIYLPRRDDAHVAVVSETPAAAPAGGVETLLLVEDDPAVQFLVDAVLTQSGYHVLTATTGVQALAVWSQYRSSISLLLTDLVMPEGMSGRQLGRRLSEDQPNLRIIYMSGYSAEIAGKDFPLKDGVNFLSKPFSAGKLLAAVRASLDARRPG
jgi:CheY-like chemotaxis protein